MKKMMNFNNIKIECMNKSISIDDIIAFIKEAMRRNFVIRASAVFHDIAIYKDDEVAISFNLEKEKVHVSNKFGRFDIDFANESEKLKFRLVIEEAKAYEEKRGIEYFNNFFDKENITINDLDDDD